MAVSAVKAAGKMTNEEHREAGRSHLEHMQELLEQHGDHAKLELHADHMRSLLAAASDK